MLGFLVLTPWLGGALPCPVDSVPAGMVCIPGGTFVRGNPAGFANERVTQEISVDSFWLDVHEVTAAQYRRCVQQGKCSPAGPNYRGYSAPRQPIVGVSWYDAQSFCQAQGKRLPTEAEFERAARGPDNTLHPWGPQRATCRRAIIKPVGAAKADNGCGRGRTWPVGSRPQDPYGTYDILGNSWEWVSDWYSDNYRACGPDCAGHNPRGPCSGAKACAGHDRKIVRGGSWYWDHRHATASRRRPHVPGNRPFHHFGFRCAQDIPRPAPP